MAAHIMVIDDDETIREFLTLCLGDEGWEVSAYDYAHIDLAAVKQLRPDLIILDFNSMSGGMGWELLQLLKMEDTTANIPVLITTTAFHLSAELRGYLLARYIQVVDKPFDLGSFLLLIHHTLSLASQAGTTLTSDRPLPILVVEDAEPLREALAAILRLEGYQVVTADNGRVALESVSSGDYCLILLDIAMPVLDGFEFLKAYDRQLRPHTPVIILSGEYGVMQQVLPSFVIDALTKPFEFDHLLSVVKKYAQPV